jgi:hypothetical protein
MAKKRQGKQEALELAPAFLVGLEEKYPWLKDPEHQGLRHEIVAEFQRKDVELAGIRGKLNTWRALPTGKDPRDAKNWDYLCTRYDPLNKTCSLHGQPYPNDCSGNWLTCGAAEGKPDAPIGYFIGMGIDAVNTFTAEIVCQARDYLCGMFLEAMNPDLDLDDPEAMGDPDFVDIEDGNAEEIRDACEAVVRNTLRAVGFPIADMDAAFKHELELPHEKLDVGDDGLDEVIKETVAEERLEANGESEDSIEDDEDEDD